MLVMVETKVQLASMLGTGVNNIIDIAQGQIELGEAQLGLAISCFLFNFLEIRDSWSLISKQITFSQALGLDLSQFTIISFGLPWSFTNKACLAF